ncbi:hypothetical protein CANINC_004989 [Pichia inconspicua]|uniref:Uncharacterized protein n=1 Tax=Pichia inconspicua TaxID=52247 RepID=A0A4T0WUL3_9ASCO|nr:hypothetical protein CANINC_004989 [[Candida] inconspicua]
MTELHTTIDRSNTRSVDKHIRSVFIDLKKQKTKLLLSSYYQWYFKNPQYHSEQLNDFDTYVRKNKDNFEEKKKIVETVYGDKYATMLTKFVRAHRLFANELMQIARDSVELSKFEGRGNLGFSKLFTDEEIMKLEEVFKLLQVETGKAIVLQTNVEKRHELKQNAANVPKELVKIKLDKEDPVRKPVRKVKLDNEHTDDLDKVEFAEAVRGIIEMNELERGYEDVSDDDDYDEPVKSPTRGIKSESEDCFFDSEDFEDCAKVLVENQPESKTDDESKTSMTTLAKVTTKAVGSIIENTIKVVHSPKRNSVNDITSNFARIELTHTSRIKQSGENV